MKAKFIILISAGLFLASVSQAQLPGNFKDSRDLNRYRQEIAFERNNNIQDLRHHHHHRHHHRHSHRAV